MGFVGFITSHFIIFGNDLFDLTAKPKSVFSEIIFTPPCPTKDSSCCGKIIAFYGDSNRKLTISYWGHGMANNVKVQKDSITKTLDTVLITYDTVKKITITQSQLIQDYQKQYSSDIEFFRKNPAFLIWATFIIAMFVMWFASFFPLWVLAEEINKSEHFSAYGLWKKRWAYFGFSFFILLGFHITLFSSILDSTPLFTTLFIPEWDGRFLLMNIIGFIACGPIFMGMMFIYRLSSELSSDETVKVTYLKERLKLFLLAISIGFSFVMITTSLLYTATNQLQLIQKVTKDMGKSPIHNDFVIAYGLIYSLLIAIFYLPAALKLYHLQAQQPRVNDDNSKPLKIDDSIKGVIGEILKSSAPLATGIISSLLGILFQS